MPSTRCVNDGQQPADTERWEHQSSEPPDCVKLRAITKSDEHAKKWERAPSEAANRLEERKGPYATTNNACLSKNSSSRGTSRTMTYL